MIPSTSITAILLYESLSSRVTSSSRGPTVDEEDAMRATFIGIKLLTNWLKFPSRLMHRKTNSTIATTIQTRLLRGRGGSGAITPGGARGGGGGGGSTRGGD